METPGNNSDLNVYRLADLGLPNSIRNYSINLEVYTERLEKMPPEFIHILQSLEDDFPDKKFTYGTLFVSVSCNHNNVEDLAMKKEVLPIVHYNLELFIKRLSTKGTNFHDAAICEAFDDNLELIGYEVDFITEVKDNS